MFNIICKIDSCANLRFIVILKKLFDECTLSNTGSTAGL